MGKKPIVHSVTFEEAGRQSVACCCSVLVFSQQISRGSHKKNVGEKSTEECNFNKDGVVPLFCSEDIKYTYGTYLLNYKGLLLYNIYVFVTDHMKT